MPILIRQAGTKWQKADDVQFADEAQLQKMLYDGPELASPTDDNTAVFVREAGLPGSGYTDLLGVDALGNIVIVETKLARNPEIRRKVIGQILEYASYLWQKSYEELDNLFLAREGKSIVDLLTMKANQPIAPDFKEVVAANLRSGKFHLFIAVDEMNDELEKIVAYVSSRGAGLRLQALELKTYKLGDLEILAPQRHGEFVPDVSSSLATQPITIDEVIDKAPDEKSRELISGLIKGWQDLGHEVRPGTVGAAFRAQIGSQYQSIFWASRGDLQAAFSVLQKNGAPTEAIRKYRESASLLPGVDKSKFLNDSQPIAKLRVLSDRDVGRFIESSEQFVRAWRAALPANNS